MFTSSTIRQRAGFTLVEMMVVIALIGILAAIVLGSLVQARESSKIAKAKEEIKNIEQAFKLYRQELGVMPPGGDHCSICGWGFRGNSISVSGQAGWSSVVSDVAAKTPISRIPLLDPWGRHYAYDNNYYVGLGTLPSVLCSVGPDGILQTWLTSPTPAPPKVAVGDDICVFFIEADDTP